MTIQLNRVESDPSRVKQRRRTRATPAGVHNRPGQQLMLYYPDQDYRFAGAFLLAMFTALSLFVLFLGVMAWEVTGCWALGVYPFAIGSMSTWIFGRATVRFAVTGRRGARRDWWLRLSSTGFEVNDRLAKPRRHEWREIDKFLLVASREEFDDGSFRVIHRVGFRYTPERRRRIATKRWTIKRPPRDRNGTTADGFVMDYWDRPLDDAVDLMNEWLARYKAA